MTRTLVLSLFLIFISYGVNSDVNSDVNSGVNSGVNSDVNSGVNTILLFIIIIIQRYIYSGGNLWVWGMNKTRLFILVKPPSLYVFVVFSTPRPPSHF